MDQEGGHSEARCVASGKGVERKEVRGRHFLPCVSSRLSMLSQQVASGPCPLWAPGEARQKCHQRETRAERLLPKRLGPGVFCMLDFRDLGTFAYA